MYIENATGGGLKNQSYFPQRRGTSYANIYLRNIVVFHLFYFYFSYALIVALFTAETCFLDGLKNISCFLFFTFWLFHCHKNSNYVRVRTTKTVSFIKKIKLCQPYFYWHQNVFLHIFNEQCLNKAPLYFNYTTAFIFQQRRV